MNFVQYVDTFMNTGSQSVIYRLLQTQWPFEVFSIHVVLVSPVRSFFRNCRDKARKYFCVIFLLV